MNKNPNVNNSSNTRNWSRKKVKVISNFVMQALSTLWWTHSQFCAFSHLDALNMWGQLSPSQYCPLLPIISSWITLHFFLHDFPLILKLKNLPSFIQWCFSFIDLSDLECVFQSKTYASSKNKIKLCLLKINK